MGIEEDPFPIKAVIFVTGDVKGKDCAQTSPHALVHCLATHNDWRSACCVMQARRLSCTNCCGPTSRLL